VLSKVLLTEGLVVIVLVLLNGALAMSELAIVSARRVRLQRRASGGDRGARAALDLANDPSKFLASVQIGITLTGILAGAFGGATIAREIAKVVAEVPALAPYAEAIGLTIVVGSVTFLSLVLGELVPKRIALGHAEAIATHVARPMKALALIARPVVALLTAATDGTLRLLRIRPSDEPHVTEDEVRGIIDQGAQAGIIERGESTMMKRVLDFGDRRVAELMTPRNRVVSLDLSSPLAELVSTALAAPHFYFPVHEGDPEHPLGTLSLKDLLRLVTTPGYDTALLRKALKEPLFIPEATPSTRLLERFHDEHTHMAIVIDEYGTTVGLVTMTDVTDAIVATAAAPSPANGGRITVDGSLPAYALPETLGFPDGPQPEGDFQTVGGFAMKALGRIPKRGDHFFWHGHRFEVLEMEGHRVARVAIDQIP